jgi:hypothetical protein
MRRPTISRTQILAALLTTTAALAAAQGLPNGGVQYMQTIQIPGWGATGSRGNANVDLMGYNPVTRMMYLADRTNKGIDVIDTRSNAVIGLIKMPPGSVYGAVPTGPNAVLVAINLQQLVVTDGLQSVYVWDLRAPQAQPDVYTFPTTLGTDTDGLDYDPINQTIYVVTDNPPEYMIGINLAYKTVVSQIALPASSDLIRWSSIDGKIYIAAEDADGNNNNAAAGVYAYDPATGPNGPVTLVSKVGPPCPGHGINIDPISDIAVMGCFGGTNDTGDVAVNLSTGTVLKTFTDAGGTDAVVFNPNLRRFYVAAGLNTATTSGCPKSAPGPFGQTTPILGIADASGASGAVTLDGVVCTGGGHIAGVDPITNVIYVPVSQYPEDPTSSTSGANGVLAFRDTTPPAQAPVSTASATLKGIGTSAATGTVQFNLVGRKIRVTASPASLPSGSVAAWLTVPTTVTDEWAACAVNPTDLSAVCNEDLIGDPLLGGTVTLSVDSGQGGVAAARGTVSGH